MRQREIEENLWRAIRHGLGGTQIDFASGAVISTREALERLVEWAGPARDALDLAVEIPEANGAQRMSDALAEGARLADVFREAVSETRRTYVPAAALG